jgi:two-component system chemotaxis response regulator CheY
MKSCLIVDDSKVIRKVARRMMEDMGFTIEEAEDGRMALDACERAMPDMVLLDWNMPVMDGLEFLKRLRAGGPGNQPKVVFCTTENSVDHIRAAIDAGADEYIMKPFDRDIIEAKLAQVGLA